MSDAELIEEYLNGSQEAFTEFYARHKDSLYTFLKNRQPETADDLFQETFLKFIGAIWQQQVQSPRAYLFRIALNLIRKSYSSSQPVIIDFNEELLPNPVTEESPLSEEELQSGLQILAREKPRFYDVLHLHIFSRFTFDRISEVTGENRNTIASRYRYALKYLRDILNSKFDYTKEVSHE
ncbi:MAG: sigma-70 family RNA polymerase sigma factor [Candidatus Cloacimonetes bacterium]|nr:sigma-70 family RNA polymerase sigma factor [Candidatus Cloacimonadota bacterium]